MNRQTDLIRAVGDEKSGIVFYKGEIAPEL